MAYIERSLLATIERRLEGPNKIIIIYGARQVGKTTLIQHLVDATDKRVLVVNGDELKYVNALSSRDLAILKGLVGGYELLVIDEAQRVPDIGINLKILHDNLPELRIIATGSSSFELANRIAEPLTGRTWTYLLHPVSFGELGRRHNAFELRELTGDMLVFGAYPEVFSITGDEEKARYLREVSSSYLYRDVLALSGIRHRDKMANLLRLLAYQIGSQVSAAELGMKLGMNRDTVSSYIDLLEQSFVVFRLRGFSRNLRKEIAKMDKIYFYDLGVRNAVIDNMKRVHARDDEGKLWENFLIMERRKWLEYSGQDVNAYFWRTYTGAEIDYVEETGGRLSGYEFNSGGKKKRAPRTWLETYPESTWQLVHPDNYLAFVGAD